VLRARPFGFDADRLQSLRGLALYYLVVWSMLADERGGAVQGTAGPVCFS
jgi:hypothetical protein